MTRTDVNMAYFDWMVDSVSSRRYEGQNSFRKLLAYLHTIEFRYCMISDSDRARDGVSLRHRFALFTEDFSYNYVMRKLDGPCSVLEMILALSIRCEEDIMSDPELGNRIGQWFWKMITNMGLGGMTDRLFNAEYVDEIIERFLEREYEPDGRGGLFYIRNAECDVRKVSIWVQMCYYLDETF